jgi:adenine-specific DNA-methyltransferase
MRRTVQHPGAGVQDTAGARTRMRYAAVRAAQHTEVDTLIKYLGSKRRLIEHIVADVDACDGVRTVLDLFSGTARVGHALKARGYRVHANDHNAYAHALALCYVAADARRWRPEAERVVAELNAVAPRAGWFTKTFCERSRYLQPHNGARVDAIRARIAALALAPELEAIALVSLMEAADRVDSTVGLQMAYLKQWAPRSYQPLRLRVPALLEGEGGASCLDAREAAGQVTADLAYLDPPYNQHSYLGNYHVWESLVRWDKPEVYGVAMKRTDVRTRASAFNRRGQHAAALREVLETLRARWLVVSFSDEGFLALDDLRALLGERGRVREAGIANPRYIGHKIGIHDPSGRKVGVPGPARNREHLFVVETGVARSPAARRRRPLAALTA